MKWKITQKSVPYAFQILKILRMLGMHNTYFKDMCKLIIHIIIIIFKAFAMHAPISYRVYRSMAVV